LNWWHCTLNKCIARKHNYHYAYVSIIGFSMDNRDLIKYLLESKKKYGIKMLA